MDITLTLVCLHHKQVGHMAGNVILVAGSIATKDLLQTNTNVSKPDQTKSQNREKTYVLELARARSQF